MNCNFKLVFANLILLLLLCFRMGAAGLLPILIKLAESGNDEEKNVAVSGLWLLSFKEENKMLLRDEPLFFEGEWYSPLVILCLSLFFLSLALKT